MIGRKWWQPWLWLSPCLILLATFLVYPSLDTIRRSFMDERTENWVWFDNFQFIIDNPQPFVTDTHAAIFNNLLWIVVFTGITVLFGLLLAVLAARVRYESLAKSAIFIPMAISFVAASVIWKFMYEFSPDIGTVNAVAAEVGKDPTAWTANSNSPWSWAGFGSESDIGPIQVNNIALIIVGVWMWTGFAMVVLSAGLKGISTEILEAARVDGANEFQIFWRIILPIMSPTIMVVVTTLVILSLKLFDLVYVMTNGRFDTHVVATLFFQESFGPARDFGVGAALAVILLIAVIPVMIISIRRFQFQEETR